MSRHQPKFLTRLKLTADNKRDALDAVQKIHEVEREEFAKLAKDSTDKNRQFFAVYLGLWVYVLLMVLATTDQMLLVPTQGIKLPLIDVTLPLLGFYVVAPLLLLAIHFNLLQNLESHHYKLMRWRKACGNIVPRQGIPAFLFNFEWLERGSYMEWLVRFGSRILFLHSGPLALGIVLWRFTDYQDIVITSWHFLAFTVSSYLVWLTETALRKNEQLDQPPSDQSVFTGRFAKLRNFAILLFRLLHNLAEFSIYLMKTFWRRAFGMIVLLQFLFACWFHFSSDGFLDGWHRIKGQSYPAYPGNDIASIVREAAPMLHSLLVPIISIDPNEAAWLPDKKEIETQAMLMGEEKATQWWEEHGVGLNISGRHLRGFFAPRANLSKLMSDEKTDLQGADMSGAQLQGAYLRDAKLQGADLSNTRLQGADLSGAELQGADLVLAHLQGADMSGAQLQGAQLMEAELQGADLAYADLQGADMSGAQLQGANLRGAQLQGANLRGAKLQGAIVDGTVFQKNRLPERTEVVGVSFFIHDVDWTKIAGMAQGIPKGKSRNAFTRHIKEANARVKLTEKEVRNVLTNHPEVVWKTVIRNWDGDNKINQEDRLAAACGLRRNFFARMDYVAGRKRVLYFVNEVNQAFCSSKHFKILCESQKQLEDTLVLQLQTNCNGSGYALKIK